MQDTHKEVPSCDEEVQRGSTYMEDPSCDEVQKGKEVDTTNKEDPSCDVEAPTKDDNVESMEQDVSTKEPDS